jgi:hypothetical protein
MRIVVGLITVVTMLMTARTVHAVDVEANCLNGGGGGLGVGLHLTDRLVLVLGATGAYGEGHFDQDRNESVTVSVPVDLKLYLRHPRAGTIAPTVRLGVAYAYQRESWTALAAADARSEWHMLAVRGLLGAEYLVTPRVGINVEGGVVGAKAVSSSTSPLYRGGYRSVGFTWLAGLVLHL